jgi:hypothetical protein
MYDYISNSGIRARLVVSVYFFLSLKNMYMPLNYCKGSGTTARGVVVPPHIMAKPLVLNSRGLTRRGCKATKKGSGALLSIGWRPCSAHDQIWI